ncbi:DNA-directed RNA polymerase subunit beta [Sporolactobacillus sp. CPB3-1]|uniref:DNA-directed RNA polymerase subunit beta n=1 Tax=Sporolactobacillus mangiferae TaxID=2940498 RepID=A0ABT0M8I1_9BACL|nr:DNA-directed RNA polymerase subunit beta [Sporolactobacillus mangiferae]MCL1631188.1 DNA-directed RNA polymerase subunit beta [Sporolactobacillus mangiferae]
MKSNGKLHNQDETRTAVRKAQKAGAVPAKRVQKQDKEKQPLYNPFFHYRKRRFPIWQRLIVLIALSAVALVGGAMFGYGGLGHRNVWAVFEPATWQHILDFLKTD